MTPGSKSSRVLIVGVGSIGERHLRCFQATGRAEMALCEMNPALRQAVAERYGVTKMFGTFDAAMAERPDAVVICTPAHLHIPMATAAAKAGVHLLIEKPLSTSTAGVDELERVIKEKGVTAGVAYVYRAHPALAAMREAVAAGKIGDVVQVVVVAGQHFPFYRPAYREIYYKDRATGGGAVQDALTHMINAAEWLVGPVERLVADFDHQVLEGVSVEDTVHVITRHPRKIMGGFILNQHQAANETSLTVVGNKGVARFEVHQSRWRWCTEIGGAWHDEPTPTMERDTWFTSQARAFMDALDGKSRVLCTVAEAAQTLRVNLGIIASVERRAWVETKAEEVMRG